jgi:hypothetical protein
MRAKRPLISRIAGWLGVDRNPLRRRTDRIESALRIALVLVFLSCGPLLALWAGNATHVSGLREVRSERGWQHVKAVVTKAGPLATSPYGAMTTTWVPGRWRTHSGRIGTGLIPTAAGTPVGSVVGVWLNRAGRVTGQQPLTAGLVLLRVVLAEIVTLLAAGLTAFLVAVWIRWLLNRRRLAHWAIEWSLVGPRWTTRR